MRRDAEKQRNRELENHRDRKRCPRLSLRPTGVRSTIQLPVISKNALLPIL